MTSTSIHDELAQARPQMAGAIDRAPGPVATAFAELSDRHQYVDDAICNLGETLTQLTQRLEPILTDGSPASYPVAGEVARDPGPVDNRSTVARSLSVEARKAQNHGDAIRELTDRLRAVLEHVEV